MSCCARLVPVRTFHDPRATATICLLPASSIAAIALVTGTNVGSRWRRSKLLVNRLTLMRVCFVRQAQSHAADRDAKGLEKVLAGVSIDASAFVVKVSGSRPGCP
jgi:hypothetical protein